MMNEQITGKIAIQVSRYYTFNRNNYLVADDRFQSFIREAGNIHFNTEREFNMIVLFMLEVYKNRRLFI